MCWVLRLSYTRVEPLTWSDSTQNGDRIELGVLTEAGVQVLNGRTIYFLGR